MALRKDDFDSVGAARQLLFVRRSQSNLGARLGGRLLEDFPSVNAQQDGVSNKTFLQSYVQSWHGERLMIAVDIIIIYTVPSAPIFQEKSREQISTN